VNEVTILDGPQRQPRGKLGRAERLHVIAKQRHALKAGVVRAAIGDPEVDLSGCKVDRILLDPKIDPETRPTRRERPA
jgi:hypothetical protein